MAGGFDEPAEGHEEDRPGDGRAGAGNPCAGTIGPGESIDTHGDLRARRAARYPSTSRQLPLPFATEAKDRERWTTCRTLACHVGVSGRPRRSHSALTAAYKTARCTPRRDWGKERDAATTMGAQRSSAGAEEVEVAIVGYRNDETMTIARAPAVTT